VAVSRDDLVFTRRALVVVAVLSTLGSVGLAGAIVAWRTSQAISSIEAKADAAVERVATTLKLVELAQVKHEAKDDSREEALAGRVSRVEDRQDRLEGRLAGWGLGPALPSERRRLRLAPSSTTGGDGG
jgi:cytoskeletal protein RodZ